MGLHNNETSDPTGANLPNLHPPSIAGTRAQRLAYAATYPSYLQVGQLWLETDTGNTYQWSTMGGGSSPTFYAFVSYGISALQGAGGTVASNLFNPITVGYVGTIGDSYSGGFGATATPYTFANIVWTRISQMFGPSLYNIGTGAGYSGNNSTDFLTQNAPTLATQIATGVIGTIGTPQVVYLNITIGINNLRQAYTAVYTGNNGPSCCLNLSLANALAPSYAFKNDVQAIIDLFQAIPGMILTLCTIPDPSNNGAGPDTEFSSWTGGYSVYQSVRDLYNTRIGELCKENNISMADIYTASQGQPGYYTNNSLSDNLHPNNQGHACWAITVARAMEASHNFNSGMMGSVITAAPRIWNNPPVSIRIPVNSSWVVAGDFTNTVGVEIVVPANAELATI